MNSGKAHSILIVEDERIVARDIQQTLQELGYDAFAIASSAEEAILRASERCPDLVLMDIRIKGERDGIETAGALRKKFGVPVVYLSAHADEGTIERAKKTEPYGYLLKPVRSAELRSVVEVSLYKHQMEKRLRERERWFSTTLRSIADAVIAVDVDGFVTFTNPAAHALTGVSAQTALGKPIDSVFQLEDGPGTGGQLPVLTALHEGRSVDTQGGKLINLATGAIRLIDACAAPVVDEYDLQTLGAVMVFRDVTEQAKTQRQLELAERLSSLGRMAAGVAHEVNNPLAVVVANACFLNQELKGFRFRPQGTDPSREGPAPSDEGDSKVEGMTQALVDLRSAASRIGRIISELKVFSRPAPQPDGQSDVVRCVQWALRTTAHEFRHRAKLVTNLDPVPYVTADETRLGQVVINLLMNAAQAIPPGNADRNEVHIGTSTDQKGQVVIEVRDTGTGIAKALLNRIFEPFFTTKEVGVGTGLGLSICHGIITALGGEIHVESEANRGTTVRVLLPAASPARAVPQVKATARARLRGRILIVDDDPLVLRVMKRILADHELCSVQSAQEALALINQGQIFDLILSDLMMPTMTGVEFYQTLLSTKPDLASRMVFLSGGAMTSGVDDFLRSVPNPKIDKPFDVQTLQDTIQRLLSEQARPAPTRP